MNPHYPLYQLRDIHTGPFPEPALWCQSGFWIALLLLLLLAFIAWRTGRLLPAAIQLIRLHGKMMQPDWLTQLNLWLKQTALLIVVRDQVAPRHGADWLQFLDQLGHTRLLQFAPQWQACLYGGHPLPRSQAQSIHRQCRRWLLVLMWRRLCLR